MRRSFLSVPGIWLLLFFLSSLLAAGCGSNQPAPRVPARVELFPSSISLGLGMIAQTAVNIADSDGQPMSGFIVTYRSNNTQMVNISPAGDVCAGTWDANFFVCTAGPAGSTDITATAGGVTSAPVRVYVHKPVDRITLAPEAPACLSQEETQEFTATAFSNNEDITATVGPMFWRSTSPPVAGLSTTNLPNNKVLAKAVQPGRTILSASLGNVVSLPAAFTTCSPASIEIREKDGTATEFELQPAATRQLEAVVVDTKGKTLKDVPVAWRSSTLPAVGVTDTGLINPIAPGHTTIVASCSVPACMLGVNEAHFSNVVRVKVPGTNSTTVYAASTAEKKVIPIPTSTHTPGTAIALPSEPNSFVFAPHAVRAYLGSDAGMMVLQSIPNTVSQNTAIKGKVLAVSLTRVVVSDTAAGRVVIWDDVEQDAAALLNLAGVTAAAIAHDESRIFLLAGSTLYVWSPATPTLRTIALSAPATGVALLANSALAYFAGGTPDNIMVRNTCNTSLVHSLTTAMPPALLAGIPDNSGILAVNPPGMQHITVQLSGATCDPVVVDTVNTVDLGAGSFAPRQIIMTTDAKFAFLTLDQGAVVAYDIENGTAALIPLASGATESFTGAATVDSKTLYVGSDHGVHRIDIATGSDEQQIELEFTPDLVVVRPQ
jgi:hypothetical protein